MGYGELKYILESKENKCLFFYYLIFRKKNGGSKEISSNEYVYKTLPHLKGEL